MQTTLPVQAVDNFKRIASYADWLDSRDLPMQRFSGDASRGYFKEGFVSVTEPFEGYNFLIGRSSVYQYKSQIPSNIVLGRHSAINATAVIGAVQHGMDRLNTGFIDLQNVMRDDIESHEVMVSTVAPTVIGCDVWIGANAVVFAGANIGHGAIVGAGAIVTKPVPPYAVVAGVPARILRYRFDPVVCERLLASAWWTLPESFLTQLPTDNVLACLEAIEACQLSRG